MSNPNKQDSSLKISKIKSDGLFHKLVWGFWGYLIVVILFGAWVRITGSGAGCGAHWPSCNGEIIPINPSLETIIEFSHRLTSGMCGVFGIGFLLYGWKRFGSSHIVFRSLLLTFFFILFEGAIGAGLVLKELVVNDDSAARAIVISLHLVNTFLLTGSVTAAALFASPKHRNVFVVSLTTKRLLYTAGVLMVAVAMAGAVTALGDTLFPPDVTSGGSIFAHIKEDLDVTSHFLVRLRIIHPFLAVFFGVLCIIVGLFVYIESEETNKMVAKWGRLFAIVCLLEILIGVATIWLAAPGYMQLIHLFFAQVLWTIWVLLFFLTKDQKAAS